MEKQNLLLVQDGNHGEYRPRRSEFVGEGIAFIRAADLSGRTVNFESASKINDKAFARIRKGIGRDLDTILSTKGTVGKIAFVPSQSPAFVCSPQTTFWRSLNHQAIDPQYLFYELQSQHFRHQIKSRKGETDMADYLSLTNQRGLTIRIPSLSEQKRITASLGSIDKKILINQRINQTLEQMAQAIFKSWFVDFEPVKAKMVAKKKGRDPEWAAMCAISGKTEAELDQLPQAQQKQLAKTAALFPDDMEKSKLGMIPQGWSWEPLGSVIDIFDSKRIPLSKSQRQKRQGPYPYYGAASIMDYVDDYLFDGIYVLMAEDGSVMNKNGNPTTQYVWGQFWVNNHAHILKGKGAVSTENILLFLKNVTILPYVTGAVQLKINQGNMKSIPFLRGSDGVHHMFGDTITSLFEAYRSSSEQVLSLAEARDTLLPKLLSGELEVKS